MICGLATRAAEAGPAGDEDKDEGACSWGGPLLADWDDLSGRFEVRSA